MALVVGLLAVLVAAVPAGSHEVDTPTLSTPEDAVREYLVGVATADLERVRGAMAADEMAAGFDFEGYIERLGVFLPFAAFSPTADPLFVEMNRAHMSMQVLGQLRMLIYSLLTDASLEPQGVAQVDRAWAASFVGQLDLERLAGLEIQVIEPPQSDAVTSERYLANAASQADVFGADELSERVAIVSLEGVSYRVGFTLLRYGQSWKVVQQTSPLSGISPTGAAERVSGG